MDPARIREAQKHTDPMDPDPQHCTGRDHYLLVEKFKKISCPFNIQYLDYLLLQRSPRAGWMLGAKV
jgi:hypothetical protein